MAMEYFLKQINPTNTTPLIICLDTEEVVVGRRNIISLSGFNKVSRRHARFWNKNGRWFVRDLGSLNKLYVNFKEVNTDWLPLEIGDIIGFGTPSYIEDGGLVCVFAARNRIKQETFDEMESPNIGMKTVESIQNVTEIKPDISVPIKQELPPSDYEDSQKKITVSEPDHTFQTNALFSSPSTLNNGSNNVPVNASDIYDPNSIIESQNKYHSHSKDSKPNIKTEPKENNENGMIGVIKTESTESLSVNQNTDAETTNTTDSCEKISSFKLQVSSKNSIEEVGEPVCKDAPSTIKEGNIIFNENPQAVGKQMSTHDNFIPEKVIKSSDKLQEMMQKAKEIKDERKASMLFNDYGKKVTENTGEKKKDKTSDKSQEVILKTKVIKSHHSRKNCCVNLVRCDSKYFRWPPEIDSSKLFEHMEEDEKSIERNSYEAIPKRMFGHPVKRKKIKESMEGNKNAVNVALNLKVNRRKNRILSSSSEMSSDGNEYEIKDKNVSNRISADEKKIKTKYKRQHEVEINQDTSQRNKNSVHGTSQALKTPEKRKSSLVENHSTKRFKNNKGENPYSQNRNEKMSQNFTASSSGKTVDLRKKEVPKISRDESAFYVQRDNFCSKYYTPEYNEFETGEVLEASNSNAIIKKKPTAGRILLTDPKPMEFRSRRIRSREEWFNAQSPNSNDQTERTSENIHDETSCSSTNSSKSSSGPKFVSSKKHFSTADQTFSTKLPSIQAIAPSKGNISVSSQKNSSRLFSSKNFASKENSSNASLKSFPEISKGQRILLSEGHISVASQKIPAQHSTFHQVISSRASASVASRRNYMDLFSDEALLASSGSSSTVYGKSYLESIPSAPVASANEKSSVENRTITSKKVNTSVASLKNSTEQKSITSKTIASIPSRKTSIELFSDEALLASSEILPVVQRKNSIEVISSPSVVSSRENSALDTLEQSVFDKSDLIQPTAGAIRMCTSPSVLRRRNSTGCRARVLVEIQTNADETFENQELTAKEKLFQPLERGNCSSSLMVKPTESINTSAFLVDEAFENKEENSKNNRTTTKINPSIGVASFPTPLLENKQMNRIEQNIIGGNKTSKTFDNSFKMEPKQTGLASETSNTNFLAKEMLESVFQTTFENKEHKNVKEQKAVDVENELSTNKLPATISKVESNQTKPIVKAINRQFLPKNVFSPIANISIEDKLMNRKETTNCPSKLPDTISNIEPKKHVAETSTTQFLPKEAFAKIDKASNDKKVAIVSPVVSHDSIQSNNLSLLDSKPYFQAPIKEKITPRVHSTYILSPVKPNSKSILPNLNPATSFEDAVDSDSDGKFNSRYLIRSIIQWNPKWLEEQAKNKKPPPLVSKGGLVLPLRYSSYDSYLKSFYPMISLEIWECLFRESKPLWLKKEVKNAFFYTVRSYKVQHGFIELQCESLVNRNLSFLPCEGNIILLGIVNIENGLENSIFGYINRHQVQSAVDMEKLKEWQDVPKEWQENAKVWTFSLHIKKSKKHFVIGSVSLAYGILNIKNKLQLADALVGFKDSPIQNDILRPTKEMFAFCKSISKIPRMQLIQTVSEEIQKENPHSKLILINAPVATGKTGSIIGIVEKLLFNNISKTKLLLCALSDMTINEIGLRLVELNERCSWRGNSIKFIRFGQSENIPVKLQAYTLETKVFKMFKEQNEKVFEEREKEIAVLEDKINNVLFKEQQKTNDKYRFRKKNDVALKQLLEQLQSLKDRSSYANINPVIHTTYESTILSESDVILATLDSCMHPLMRKFCLSCKGESRACCIVDEISQCTELEVLQCLHPEIDRLVLVGDLQQLQPQVSSKYAAQWGFKRSMLERISKLFSVQFSCTPPLSLTEQHRMQSQICRFSSKYFYKDELSTSVDVDEKYKSSPLKPFVVYDILEREIPNPPVNIEDNEPFIIANICAQLLQAVPIASLGVIVPHEDLAALYKIPLCLGNSALKGIEVNTVENFQGIEKDIIIVSCVNPSLFTESESFLTCEKKLNVALTRARQSLVICGHISSLVQYEHWAALVNDAKLRKNFISVSSLRQIPFVIMKTICRTG